jgi:hypothetical protein
MSSSSVYGFNPGYSLSSMSLSDVPSPRDVETFVHPSLYTPNILSLNHPAANVNRIQQSLNLAGSGGQYVARVPLTAEMEKANQRDRDARPVCRNINSSNLSSSGAAQCIDAQGFCRPPINMRCPPDSVFFNQFSGARGGTSVSNAGMPLLRK